MGTINKDIQRFDVTAVYTHPDAKVDIILIHGLNGHPAKTWTAKNGIYWPTDLLPKTLQEDGVQANIYVYGFNADVAGNNKDKNPSSNYIHQHAQNLVNFLTTFRKKRRASRNPIIWVAHSLGGILLKRALEHSDSVRAATHLDARSIYVSTFAIVFLGTPHDGSDLAKWGEMLQAMVGYVPRKWIDTEPVLIKTLKRDNETLDNINANFVNIQQRFKIHLVYESQKSDLRGTKSLIVDSKSAAPNWYGTTSYGIEADHSGMCKFASVNAPGYRHITSVITDWVQDAPGTIVFRWQVEDQSRSARTQADLNEQALTYLSQTADGSSQVIGTLSSPRLGTPVVGGGDSPARLEHGETDTHIVEERETGLGGLVSPNGTTALSPEHAQTAPPSPLPMLQRLPMSQPGTQESSRTQNSGNQILKEPYNIAPEGFRSNSYFVGREKELEELHHMLIDTKRRSEGTSTVLVSCQTGGGKTHMAREYYFRHRGDYTGGMFWLCASSVQELEGEFSRISKVALKDLRGRVDQEDLEDHTQMVDHVRMWFEGLEDWLLIFDGIMFDQEGVERFFPDRINTSMILLSTSSVATGSHHFNNPRPLQLPPLPLQEAQKLLLMEIDKEEPWSHADLAQAAELVRILEKLPLMIHVIAQHLKSSSEPLSTYLKRYKSRPPHLGRVPAYDLVIDQMQARGAYAALNVLCVLAFMDQHIPVEMISMGLRVLDKKSTPYKTREVGTNSSGNLNNTLKVLVAFALVQRSDRYDLSRTSSKESKRSFDLSDETMDTLHIHGIVQRYLIEYLAERKLHIFWLERSAEVFFRAFEDADSRIKGKPNIGLPEDYRRFGIHCRKLIEHLCHHEKHHKELRPIREKMEAELTVIEAEVERLSRRSQTDLVHRNGGSSQTSVFDKAKSLSDSDTGTTGSQSQPTSQEGWTSYEEDQTEFFSSPTETVTGRFSGNAEAPYPLDDDVPTPQGTPRPAPSQLQMPVPKDYESHNVPQRGSRASSKRRVSTHRTSEQSLATSGQGSLDSSSGGGLLPSRDRRFSSSSGSRRRDIIQRLFSREVFNKENIPFVGPRRRSSASSSSRTELPVPTSVHTSPGIEQMATMPSVPKITPRSASSSPGNDVAPSPFSPPGLPGQRSSPHMRQTPPPSLQQWKSTPSYQPQPYLGRVESSSLGEGTTAVPDRVPKHAIPSPASQQSSRPSSQSRDSGHRSTDSGLGGLVIPGPAGRPRRDSSPFSSPVNSISPTPRRRPNVSRGGSRSPSIRTQASPRISPLHDVMEPPSQPPINILPSTGLHDSINASGAVPRPTLVSMPTPKVPMPPATGPARRQSRYEQIINKLASWPGRAQSESPAVAQQGGDILPRAEAMARSASGGPGVVIGEGSDRRQILFGEVLVDVHDADERKAARQARHRAQHERATMRGGEGSFGMGPAPETGRRDS